MTTPKDNFEQYQTTTKWFRHVMINRLLDNTGKGGWQKEAHTFLMMELSKRSSDLELLIKEKASAADIANKAADIANFAMMIADNAITRQHKKNT